VVTGSTPRPAASPCEPVRLPGAVALWSIQRRPGVAARGREPRPRRGGEQTPASALQVWPMPRKVKTIAWREANRGRRATIHSFLDAPARRGFSKPTRRRPWTSEGVVALPETTAMTTGAAPLTITLPRVPHQAAHGPW